MAAEVAAGIGLLVLFIIFFWLFVFIAMILLFIFWIFMIVDVAKRQFKKENDKIAWILVVILAGYIGAIVYYFVIKREDKH